MGAGNEKGIQLPHFQCFESSSVCIVPLLLLPVFFHFVFALRLVNKYTRCAIPISIDVVYLLHCFVGCHSHTGTLECESLLKLVSEVDETSSSFPFNPKLTATVSIFISELRLPSSIVVAAVPAADDAGH